MKRNGMVVLCAVVAILLFVTTWLFRRTDQLPALPSDIEIKTLPALSTVSAADKGGDSWLLSLSKEGKEDTEELLKILKTRMDSYTGSVRNFAAEVCKKNEEMSKVCFNTTCPGQFSPSLRDRLQQILSARAAIPAQYLEALRSAAQSVTSHKYIFVTGVSSNHYQEMQALLHTVFNSLLPRMQGEDYALLLYNLGLTEEERRLTEKNCRCTVLDFPFSGLPEFVKDLKCYVWKPLIVASLLEKAEYVIWIDASIRFRASDPFPEVFQRAKAHGYQTRINDGSIAVRTRPSAAEFFGDHLCQYSPFSEMETNFFIVYNDRFMREAIMKPWLACAFNRSCMCVPDHRKYLVCRTTPPNRILGRCHRYEQSAIGMIMSKLYLGKRHLLHVPRYIQITRDTKMNWFSSS